MKNTVLVAVAIALAAVSCAGHKAQWQPDEEILTRDDPAGDVRLEHPPHPEIARGTFDLKRLDFGRSAEYVFVTATFAAPVRPLAGVRLTEDKVVDIYPQTIDIYLDTKRGTGYIEALPGRGFHVPASEAWDKVLVISSLPDPFHAEAVRPLHLTASGRKLTAVFRRQEVPDELLGVLAVVMATSVRGEGRVLPVKKWRGDCQNWDQERCNLYGEGPAVIDASTKVEKGKPIRLSYLAGSPPPSTLR